MTTCIGTHDGVPPLAEPGAMLCPRCTGRLRRDLADVATLWPLMVDLLEPGANGTASRGKPGSRPPCNLDIADITDVRGQTHAQIVGWARIVIEERRLAATPADAEQAVRLLTIHAAWITEQPWVDEMAAEIHDAAHRIRRACGETGVVPLGTCSAEDPRHPGQDCGGPLYWIDGSMMVRCSRCHDTWDEGSLMAMTTVVDVWVAVADAAALLGLTTRTINRYAEAGHIRRDRGRVVYSDVVQHIRSKPSGSGFGVSLA